MSRFSSVLIDRFEKHEFVIYSNDSIYDLYTLTILDSKNHILSWMKNQNEKFLRLKTLNLRSCHLFKYILKSFDRRVFCRYILRDTASTVLSNFLIFHTLEN